MEGHFQSVIISQSVIITELGLHIDTIDAKYISIHMLVMKTGEVCREIATISLGSGKLGKLSLGRLNPVDPMFAALYNSQCFTNRLMNTEKDQVFLVQEVQHLLASLSPSFIPSTKDGGYQYRTNFILS
jgi:hypothetical protein